MHSHFIGHLQNAKQHRVAHSSSLMRRATKSPDSDIEKRPPPKFKAKPFLTNARHALSTGARLWPPILQKPWLLCFASVCKTFFWATLSNTSVSGIGEFRMDSGASSAIHGDSCLKFFCRVEINLDDARNVFKQQWS